MKKIILASIIIITLASCQNQKVKTSYEITGTLRNIPDSSIVYISADNKYIDSTRVFNESFKLSGLVEAPTNVYLMVKNSRDYKSFWLENNKIYFEAEQGKFKEAKITGSKTQEEDNLLSERLKSNLVKMENLENSFEESMTEVQIDSLKKQYEALEREETIIYQDFVKEFPGSLVSSNILNIYASTWGKEKTVELFNSFSSENKNSAYGKEIAKYIELNKEPKIGEHFIDFEMTNNEGNLRKVSDLKGKIILLEFWASWCDPCRQENPNLVKTYNKFKPKGFEIFAVSLDINKDSWLKAIDDDGLNWIHVSELNGDKNTAGLIYGVNGIPDNFLIDKNGVIIGRNLRGEKLNKKLKEILE